MSAASDILARIRISQVYQALTGIKPRGRGETWRVPAPWRKTSDCNVSLHDGKGTWYDFVVGEGGGVIDLVARVRGGVRESALRWLADFSGAPLKDRLLSPDRERWAQERRKLQRDLPAAELWRRAAVALGEEVLARLKTGLFDPAAPMRPEIGEVAYWTARIARWRRISGIELVSEYRECVERHPKMTRGLIHAAKMRAMAERHAIKRYLRIDGAGVDAS